MKRKPDPTEEQANEETEQFLVHMASYFAKYYGPRCKEFEPGCPVCEVWKLYDAIEVWIK